MKHVLVAVIGAATCSLAEAKAAEKGQIAALFYKHLSVGHPQCAKRSENGQSGIFKSKFSLSVQ